MDIAMLFTASDVAKVIAHYSGLIDSLDAKVDRLIEAELNAAVRSLEQASAATRERKSLLRDARLCFTKAISLETGLRSGLALLGCATCHHLLGDEANVRPCLQQLLALRPLVNWEARIKAAVASPFSSGPKVSPDLLFLLRCAIAAGLGRNKQLQEEFNGLNATLKQNALNEIAFSRDGKTLLELQRAVSVYIASPITWLEDLGILIEIH